MPKHNLYTLREAEQSEIERAIRYDNRVEVVQRCTAIRMLHLAYLPQQVADLYQVRLSTLYNWYHRWQKGGVEGLANQPKPGRRRKAGEAYWAALDQVLEQDPSALGYVFSVWTVESLRDHLEQQTGIHLSLDRLRVQMKERGYVWRQPKHDLHALQDAEARADALALLGGLKKAPKPGFSSYSMWTKVP